LKIGTPKRVVSSNLTVPEFIKKIKSPRRLCSPSPGLLLIFKFIIIFIINKIILDMSCSLTEKRHFLVIIISVRFWSTQFILVAELEWLSRLLLIIWSLFEPGCDLFTFICKNQLSLFFSYYFLSYFSSLLSNQTLCLIFFAFP
jgi:hypothetical protein